jgi:uncharacterized protein with PhoU and TrkA domain
MSDPILALITELDGKTAGRINLSVEDVLAVIEHSRQQNLAVAKRDEAMVRVGDVYNSLCGKTVGAQDLIRWRAEMLNALERYPSVSRTTIG